MTFITAVITYIQIKSAIKNPEDDSIESFMPVKW
jgi:hypothetical protein